MKPIEELRAAHAAASGVSDCKVRVIESDPYRARNVISGGLILAECHGSTADAEAAFIALAHNEWVAMLDEIERLRAEIEAHRERANSLMDTEAKRFDEILALKLQLRAACETGVNQPLVDDIERFRLECIAARREADGANRKMTKLIAANEQATQELVDVKGTLEDLREAARDVCDNWANGDLAACVRRLAEAIDVSNRATSLTGELIKAQLDIYPKSVILTPIEAYDKWVSNAQPPAWAKVQLEEAHKTSNDTLRRVQIENILKAVDTFYKDTYRSLARMLAYYPNGVLYEQRDAEGIIQLRGCRYGTEPHEYVGPFID